MNPYKEQTIILVTKQKWCLHCIYVTWDIKNGTEAMNKCFKHKQDHNELHYRKPGACMCVLLQISVTPSLPPIDWLITIFTERNCALSFIWEELWRIQIIWTYSMEIFSSLSLCLILLIFLMFQVFVMSEVKLVYQIPGKTLWSFQWIWNTGLQLFIGQ